MVRAGMGHLVYRGHGGWLLFSVNQVSLAMPLIFLKKYFYKTYAWVVDIWSWR